MVFANKSDHNSGTFCRLLLKLVPECQLLTLDEFIKALEDKEERYVLKENIMIMNNNETTQTITKQQLKEIWKVACDSWKKTLEDYAKKDVFSDVITFTNKEVEEMFKAANADQTIVLEKFLRHSIEDKNAFSENFELSPADLRDFSENLFDDMHCIQILNTGALKDREDLCGRAFYVPEKYEVKIGKARAGTYIEILKKA